jgi:hypothetical protein
MPKFRIYGKGNQSSVLPSLLKTVLVDHQGKVSGLESQGSFIDYFLKYESQFFDERLSQVPKGSVIFTFGECPSFFTLMLLSKVKLIQILF